MEKVRLHEVLNSLPQAPMWGYHARSANINAGHFFLKGRLIKI